MVVYDLRNAKYFFYFILPPMKLRSTKSILLEGGWSLNRTLNMN